MIKISKSGNSILVEGLDNVFYPGNGKLTFPSNSLILTIDESEMATFKSAANNDVMFSGLIENITINDEVVTKDDIISKFGVIANSTGGSGPVDAYTKTESDNRFQGKLTAGTNITISEDNVISATGGGGETGVTSVNGQTGDVTLEIPTLQTEETGTNKNYIYSDDTNSSYSVMTGLLWGADATRISCNPIFWGFSNQYRLSYLPSATTSAAGVMTAADKSKLDAIPSIQVLTQAEYDALPSKDANTLYFIKE